MFQDQIEDHLFALIVNGFQVIVPIRDNLHTAAYQCYISINISQDMIQPLHLLIIHSLVEFLVEGITNI